MAVGNVGSTAHSWFGPSLRNRAGALGAHGRVALALTVLITLSAGIIPALRLPLYVSGGVIATLVCGWRAAQRAHPAGRWLSSTAALGCVTAGGVAQLAFGPTSTAVSWFTVIGAVCALPAGLLLVMATKDSFGRERGRWAECLLIALVLGGVSLQLATMHAPHAMAPATSPGYLIADWPVVSPSWPPFDLLLLCLLMRLIVTRSYLPLGIRLQLGGIWLLLSFELVVGAAGHRMPAAHDAILVLGVLAMLLIAWGLALPSATFRLPHAEQYPPATGSMRLLSTFSLVLAVPAVWICGRLGLVPTTSAALAAVSEGAIALCVLWLAVQSLRVVEELAERDAVTGVTNRRGLPRAVRTLLAGRAPHSCACLAVIDLDGFKQVNDRYGHSVGDGLLHAVAQRLRACVGERGAVCRIGGDEFVVVYVQDQFGSGPQAASSALSRRIAAALEPPCQVGALEIQASASVGVTPLNRASDLVQVMVNSDAAMYAAKQTAKANHNRDAANLVDEPFLERQQVR